MQESPGQHEEGEEQEAPGEVQESAETEETATWFEKSDSVHSAALSQARTFIVIMSPGAHCEEFSVQRKVVLLCQ